MSTQNAPKWAHGYRTDLEYTSGLYAFLNPDLLLLRLALLGIDPTNQVVSTGKKDTRNLNYCELGSGQGMSLNFMAARDPGGTYIGIDYNPAQVKNARNFAEAAKLKNVTFYEESFENLDDLDMPDLDIIVLHGIWSWISKEMRDKVVQFIRKRLKPGGLVYNSYNCTVGRASEIPLRRLFISAERAENAAGNKSVANAIELMSELSDAGAGYFARNDMAKTRLQEFSKQDPAYIIHEYLNDAWHPFFFHEVAAELKEAKLNFAGQFAMARNMPKLALPKEALHHLARFTDQADQELLKDIWTNNAFRQDIYVKGAQTLSARAQEKILEELRFTLALPRDQCTLNAQVAGGSVKIPEAPFTQVMDGLDGKIVSGSDISAIIQKHAPSFNLSRVISILLALGYVSLATDAAAVSRISGSLAGFNSAVEDLANAGVNQFIVALPAIGSFKSLNALNYYIWQATARKIVDRESYVFNQLKATNRELRQKNVAVSTPKEGKALIGKFLEEFDKKLKPFMRFA